MPNDYWTNRDRAAIGPADRAPLTMVLDHGTVDLVETVSISQFKATCLARIAKVKRTGQSLLITRKGEPMAEVKPPSRPKAALGWLGSLQSTGRIVGDIVSPAAPPDDWEALG